MDTTSASLLMSLRESASPAAWSRFVRTYSPMLYAWARRSGLQEADALDLVQDVFATLVEKLPKFTYDADRGFREWLWVVTRNKHLERTRRLKLPIDAATNADQVPDRPAVTAEEDDFRRHLLGHLVPSLKGQFQPTTWAAFWASVVEGRPATEVGAELGLSVDAVYKAKARVVARLHTVLSDVIAD
ncbi:RNA polymerase sigma factor [Fimbriiglobus ruber]|uniref:RNA polymerase sigma factor Y n=1 Tax=Fimbriiglobus ruber TaxID=1908690 RepID=A0A225EAH5_9BACT|nr:sigma-70 family RNA polymerase sigma factor [Fimbriiglobus ruber]OWK46389.1 RNA polymerase sigma factor Y [Fimbriiglobus ruber]